MTRYYLTLLYCWICLSIVPVHAESTSGIYGADNGIISFSGQIVDRTCLISGNEADKNFIVQLPQVVSGHLQREGQRDGDTEFRIKLTGCGHEGQGVRVKFESTVSTHHRTKRFLLSPAESPQDMAKNVMIEVEDQMTDQPIEEMTFRPIDHHGNAEMIYIARYYATAAAQVGKVHSRVTYTLEYQ